MAKKMYLVDQRVFNSLKTPWQNAVVEKFQEASWSKPPEKRSKTELHRDMYNLLERNELADDEKAKLYNQQLIRFLNTNKGAEMQPTVIKPEPMVDPTPVPTKLSKRKQRKKKAVSTWEELPGRDASSDRDSYSLVKVSSKKKKKKASVRRSSRPRKPIQWDPL